MALPADLYFMRHAESEGNVALEASQRGEHDVFRETVAAVHSGGWRLSSNGVAQAKQAGEYIKERLGPFTRYIVSEYARAQETAALLGLDGAQWEIDFYLCERNWGLFDSLSLDVREQRYADVLELEKRQAFFWHPPHGESLAEVALRIDWFLHNLRHNAKRDDAILVIGHEEAMWTIRVLLERLPIGDFRDRDRPLHIEHCDILHYSMRHPGTGLRPPGTVTYRYVRAISPLRKRIGEWREIVPRALTNDELLARINSLPRLLDERSPRRRADG
jgi:NAD+ kinase